MRLARCQAVVHSSALIALIAHVSMAQGTTRGLSISLVQVRAIGYLPGNVSSDCERKGDISITSQDKWEPEDNVILIPAAKLAFCSIPKVASSDFDALFLFANGQPPDDCTSDCMEHAQGSNAESLGIEKSQITKANGWTYAFFVRDPLDRYLSAFGSKCVPKDGGDLGDSGHNCCGDFITKAGASSEYVELFEEHVRIDHQSGLPILNLHWAPQTEILQRNCGLFDPSEADYIGQLSKGDVNLQVKEMLQKAGVEDSGYLADQFFPSRGPIDSGHASTVSDDYALFYRNHEIAQDVADLYTEDYGKLPLDPPILDPTNL